jgi:hypothetical protein
VLLALVATLWTGTVEGELIGDQPGAQHTSRTRIELRLEERPGADGTFELVAVRARFLSSTEITGNGHCTGAADVVLHQEAQVVWSVDAFGGFKATIPRAFGGWTCGRNVASSGARAAELGHGLDPEVRFVQDGRASGSYDVTRRTRDTRYRFMVRWKLRREKP